MLVSDGLEADAGYSLLLVAHVMSRETSPFRCFQLTATVCLISQTPNPQNILFIVRCLSFHRQKKISVLSFPAEGTRWVSDLDFNRAGPSFLVFQYDSFCSNSLVRRIYFNQFNNKNSSQNPNQQKSLKSAKSSII